MKILVLYKEIVVSLHDYWCKGEKYMLFFITI